jgi:hypothetical protein
MNIAQENLSHQLGRQLTFLRNSAKAYDAGDVEEAVRIGTVIRVLLHDTKSSVSLLNHMKVKESLRLITTAKTVPEEQLVDIDFGEFLSGMTIGNDLRYDPFPKDSPTIGCCDWWTQPVFYRDKIFYARQDVVLSAANKDGGAHVDIPDNKLLALQEGFWIKTTVGSDGQKTSTPLSNNHFRMLRRFSDELLQSKDLLDLAQ